MDKNKLINQTENAFDFIQKLYFECSYLVKELEGLFAEEEENFIIGRPSGYAINTRSSVGLERNNVRLWLLRKFAVFFIPEEFTRKRGGMTITSINDNLKVIYIRFILNNNDIKEPQIYTGVLDNIEIKKDDWSKFEKLMGHFEYCDDKLFQNIFKLDYEDSYCKIQGRLIKNNLYDINNSEAIMEKIVVPTLDLYRN